MKISIIILFRAGIRFKFWLIEIFRRHFQEGTIPRPPHWYSQGAQKAIHIKLQKSLQDRE